jgi:hypothetical protein
MIRTMIVSLLITIPLSRCPMGDPILAGSGRRAFSNDLAASVISSDIVPAKDAN